MAKQQNRFAYEPFCSLFSERLSRFQAECSIGSLIAQKVFATVFHMDDKAR